MIWSVEERELEEVLSLCTVSGRERDRELEEVLSLCMVSGGEKAGRDTIPLHSQWRRENWKKYYPFAQSV